MREIRKILFATDFSDANSGALAMTRLLQKKLGFEVDILHVFDPSHFEMPAPYDALSDLDQWLTEHFHGFRERGRHAVDELVPSLPGTCHAYWVEGRPETGIVDYARNHASDLIVMGSRGHGSWPESAIGGVARYVVRHAPCPVLTIQPEDPDPDSAHEDLSQEE